MVQCYNVSERFVQSISGVDFVSDNDGKTAYASFGGQKQRITIDQEDDFGAEMSRIAMWILASVFGSKEATETFLGGIVPLLKGGFIRRQGWFSFDSVQNCLVRVWYIVSGVNTKAKKFDPSKGGISTWLDASIRRECEDQKRYKSRIKRDSGLSCALALDGKTELSSIGDKGLFGLVFEVSDPQEAPRKGGWIRTKKVDTVTDRVIEKEEGKFLERLLDSLPLKEGTILREYGKGMSLSEIADRHGMSKMGVQKSVMRTINALRTKNGLGPIVSLGGKKRQVKMIEPLD